MQPSQPKCEVRVSVRSSARILLRGVGMMKLRLRLVERSVGDVGLRCGEVGQRLAGRVVAPGADGVEVGEQLRRQLGGELFSRELDGEAGGEVLHHHQADEHAVARLPGTRRVVQHAKLGGEMTGVGGDERVDAARVVVEIAEFFGLHLRDDGVGGVAYLEEALGLIVLHLPGPRISANSPAAWRRSMSICQRRSCAVTYPCAKARSSSEAARMCGMPRASRRTVTGAVRPATWMLPSTCGREARMARWI